MAEKRARLGAPISVVVGEERIHLVNENLEKMMNFEYLDSTKENKK